MKEAPALQAAEARVGRRNVRVLMIESAARLRRLPYQRKKLVLLLSAMRHYAVALRDDGWQVDYVKAETYAQALDGLKEAPIVTMAASGRGLRALQEARGMEVLANRQFLSTWSGGRPLADGAYDPKPDADPRRRYLMEHFYRGMRRHFKVLLDDDGGPVGGKWNYDADNRKPLPRGTRLPAPPEFEPDALTAEVMAEVAAMPGIGTVDGFDLAVTHHDAERAFHDFLRHRLALFGPYEDAMQKDERILFHSVMSPYMNLGLLSPLDMVRATERAYREGKVPLSSAEGFIRQVMGWREFIWWQYWRLGDVLQRRNHLRATHDVPSWFWDGETRMSCLQHVIRRAIEYGWTHHIERLMVVSNFAVLAGLRPAAVNDWFLSLFVDAYEWVMVPNVYGMGLHADGGLTATRPYVSTGAYIHRMSDFCRSCAYDVKTRNEEDSCPFNALYWDFLIRHRKTLDDNVRMKPIMKGVDGMAEAERNAVQARARRLMQNLDTL